MRWAVGISCAGVLWAVVTARRLDRLHRRVDSTRARFEELGAAPASSEELYRAELSRRFYNQAVMETRALRLNPVVRVLRLEGTAPLPHFAGKPDAR
ncbi:hypothetical protein KIP68_00325 [Corynebacterium aquatimens]